MKEREAGLNGLEKARRMGNDVRMRGAPQAPWSAVALATAFMIDQFSSPLV